MKMELTEMPKTVQHTTSGVEQPIVQVVKNQVVTSSLQIAKMFGKEHAKVLTAIRNMDCSNEFIAANFGLYHYMSELNENVTRRLPMYYLTRDGFTFLAMGFTGKMAAKFKEDYINAFNEMEKSLRDVHEKGLVSVKLLKDQKLQTEYWKEIANSGINNVSLVADNFKRISDILEKNQIITTNFRPNKFYYLTEEYFNVVVKSFSDWLYYENVNGHAPDVRDNMLVHRLQAARLLYCDLTKTLPVSIALNPERRW